MMAHGFMGFTRCYWYRECVAVVVRPSACHHVIAVLIALGQGSSGISVAFLVSYDMYDMSRMTDCHVAIFVALGPGSSKW